MERSIHHHAQSWRALRSRCQTPIERGLERLLVAGAGVVRRLATRPSAYLAMARAASARRAEVLGLSESERAERCVVLRRAWAGRSISMDQRIQTLALLREQARCSLGLEPHEVQLAASAALFDGCIVEMATGEGKTLVAGVAATALGWRGRGCHVITVNDYLVERDAGWMGALFRACGVSVGHIVHGSNASARAEAYACDVTYATSKEAAADYLRDRLVLRTARSASSVVLDVIGGAGNASRPALLQRGLECAIVDEADSVLIDEAVTPLILSGAAPNEEERLAVREASEFARGLVEGEHYAVDRRHREVRLQAQARGELTRRAAGLGPVWRGPRRAEELIVQAITARECYLNGTHYVVRDGRVVIVDEFTGRPMHDRTWRGGLHQAIEAKERLAIQPAKETLAGISFQKFFRSYRMLSGMSGTAREAAHELWMTYRRPVLTIPTHRPVQRRCEPACVLRRSDDRWLALLDEVECVQALGRPVLVGVRTVEASERISGMLSERGIAHATLNAVRHDHEAAVIARAGSLGAVTIATNMAGRGTDIRLGPGALELGGLHVILAEPHEAGRIDRQFFGRAARQGDPGSARLFLSLEDNLFKRSTPLLARIVRRVHAPAMVGRLLVRMAQSLAERDARVRREAVQRSEDGLERGLGFAGAERV